MKRLSKRSGKGTQKSETGKPQKTGQKENKKLKNPNLH